MNRYIKPVVIANEDLAEGVYTASGADCYTVSAYIHQVPEMGRETYCVQVNGSHDAADGHHSGAQVLTLTFNQPVTYVSSNGNLVSGDGTNAISISYTYHNNAYDKIGLGDVYVTSGPGLALAGDLVLTCNHDCGQH